MNTGEPAKWQEGRHVGGGTEIEELQIAYCILNGEEAAKRRVLPCLRCSICNSKRLGRILNPRFHVLAGGRARAMFMRGVPANVGRCGKGCFAGRRRRFWPAGPRRRRSSGCTRAGRCRKGFSRAGDTDHLLDDAADLQHRPQGRGRSAARGEHGEIVADVHGRHLQVNVGQVAGDAE